MFAANVPPPPGGQPPFTPRIFDADGGAPDDPRQYRLREAFDRYFEPIALADKSAGTRTAYRNLLSLWERFTSDPAIGAITSASLVLLRRALEEAKYAPATIGKQFRHLRAFLRLLGPATDGNPRGMGILATVPWVESPRVGRKLPRTANHDEIDRLYDACRVAVWPQISRGDVPAPAFWRALLVSFTILGPRAWEILHDGSDRRDGWFWHCLNGTYCRSSIGTQLSSITFRQKKTGNELTLPVPPVLIAHLESIRTDRLAIFPVTLAHGSVYGQWRAIKAAAGVGVEGTQELDFHDLRRTCQTEWDWLKLGMGDWILGHAPQDVGGRSYRNFERHAAEACEQLPLPKSFQTIFERIARQHQKHLF